MSTGSIEARTVGYVIGVEGSNQVAAGQDENGGFNFAHSGDVVVYSSLNAVLRAAHNRENWFGSDVTIKRVVERTITETERSYEAL